MINFGKIILDAQNFVKESLMFRSLSFGLAGLLLAVFGRLSGNTLNSQVGLFNWLLNPFTFLALAIPSIVSIYMLYKKHWQCNGCHKRKLMKGLHILGTFGTGLAVSFFSYFTSVFTMFLTDANIQSGGMLNNSIWYVKIINDTLWFLPLNNIVWIVPVAMFPMLFVMQDIFNSYDGKSGVIFGNDKPFAIGIRWLVKKLRNHVGKK